MDAPHFKQAFVSFVNTQLKLEQVYEYDRWEMDNDGIYSIRIQKKNVTIGLQVTTVVVVYLEFLQGGGEVEISLLFRGEYFRRLP